MEKFLGKIDKTVFAVSSVVCLFFVLWGLLFPEHAGATFNVWLAFFTGNFGWLYLIIVTCFVLFLIFLCVHKVGGIKLGKDDDVPKYKTSTWFFMLFCSSMGIGLVFWGVAEPIYHLMAPPFHEAMGAEAAEAAMRTSFIHWGLHPWAVYGIIGVSLAYWQYRKDKPAMISSALIPLYGEKGAIGWMGKSVDILAVFATIFGVATSLGLGAMQITSGLSYVYNTPNTTTVTVIIVAALTAAFIISAVSGIDRGMLQLSRINIWLCLALMLFILFAGPTLFILNVFTNALGTYFTQFLRISFWTDPYGTNPGWLGSWTVFYWAWWLTWGPFVGGFIARISKGRTIREFIIGALFCPVLVCFIWFSIMGGTAINFELAGNHVVSEAISVNVANALFAMLGQLPLSVVLCAVATVLVGIFFITSADSSTFVCSMMTSYGVQNPNKKLRIFWGVIMGFVAIVLLIAGGLTAVQTIAIVAAFPFMLVCVAIMVSMFKSFRKDPYMTGTQGGED
jgi:glycine betaine transporter